MTNATAMPDESARHLRTWMAVGASTDIWGSKLLPEVRGKLCAHMGACRLLSQRFQGGGGGGMRIDSIDSLATASPLAMSSLRLQVHFLMTMAVGAAYSQTRSAWTLPWPR